MDSNEKVDYIFNLLQESGAIELTGLDSNGQPTYKITDICEEVFPEFFKMHKSGINEIANTLWQKGIVDMTFGAKEEDQKISFTEHNYEQLQAQIDTLSEDEIQFLIALGAPIKTIN
jgi:hypothetical protein